MALPFLDILLISNDFQLSVTNEKKKMEFGEIAVGKYGDKSLGPWQATSIEFYTFRFIQIQRVYNEWRRNQK